MFSSQLGAKPERRSRRTSAARLHQKPPDCGNRNRQLRARQNRSCAFDNRVSGFCIGRRPSAWQLQFACPTSKLRNPSDNHADLAAPESLPGFVTNPNSNRFLFFVRFRSISLVPRFGTRTPKLVEIQTTKRRTSKLPPPKLQHKNRYAKTANP